MKRWYPATRWQKTIILFFTVVFCVTLSCGVLIATAPTNFVCLKNKANSIASPPTLSDADKTLIRSATSNVPNYRRPMESTFLTFPEWYIVYSSQEYGQFITSQKPSRFPYFSAIRQYWASYRCLSEYTQHTYPYNSEVHTTLKVIGVSFTIENAIKGLHEQNVGQLTELLRGNQLTPEDEFVAHVAQDYGTFLNLTSWYKYPFGTKLIEYWQQTPMLGSSMIRKWERKLFFSTEYVGKAMYGWIIKKATQSAYSPAPEEIQLVTSPLPEKLLKEASRFKVVSTIGENFHLITMPRYSLFTELLPQLFESQVQIIEIGGNTDIMLTVLADQSWDYQNLAAEPLFEMKVLSQTEQKRVGLLVPVASLSATLQALDEQQVALEHVYDY